MFKKILQYSIILVMVVIKMTKYSKYLKIIFGMRTLKTALAAGLTLIIAQYLNIDTPVLAITSVIVAMTSSIFSSYIVSINRILSTIIGALIASIFQYFQFTNILAMMLGIIIVINICNFFNWQQTIILSCIIFVIILSYEPVYSTDPSFIRYSISRLIVTTLGLIIGFLVNVFIAPPNREIFLLATYKKTLKELEDSFQLLLANKKNIKIENLVDDINQINTELKAIRNDKKLFKNKDFKITAITRINYDFYSAFGLISQLSESENLPNITEENIESIKKYFGYIPVIIATDEDEELKFAFNYYLDELILLLNKLQISIKEFAYDPNK